MSAWIGTAFALGLAGSMHCAGMCGPLMVALPSARRGAAVWLDAASYQLGRIGAYTVLGLFFGLIGKGISLAGFQQLLAVGGGAVLLGGALFPLVLERKMAGLPVLRRLGPWVQRKIGVMLQRRSRLVPLTVGALNGLLPCGLVYAALAGAISTAGGWEGGVFMAAFGAGTTPLLLVLMSSSSAVSITWRRRLRRLQPLILAAMGVWLIWRGLQLDLSLFEAAVPKARLECH